MIEKSIQTIIEICNKALFQHESGWKNVGLPDVGEIELLLKIAGCQGVLSSFMHGLLERDYQDEELRDIIITWYGIAEKSQRGYKKRVMLMENLAKVFKKAGLDVMFIKGATLAKYYPVPEWRMFSDIDFYLYGDYDEGILVLKDIDVDFDEGFHHHSTGSLFDILLENHYDFVDRVNHKCNILIDDELKKLAVEEGKNCPFTFGDTTIDNAYCMTPTMNAIFLIRHMSTHFASETIPLRMLYDWALFLKKDSGNVDWNRVLHIYEQSGMDYFAGMIQGILVEKFHINIAECPIKPIMDATTERIWNSIIDSSSKTKGGRSLLGIVKEATTFFRNRWKYKVAFPPESFWRLCLSFIWVHLKSRLKI
ncbi:MAG: nucleotidyltransferase family protein [Prevotella sp.]|nr:nucleotidyltransferase family protein [Prevotella sp.]